jgi:hypothetical protein
MRAAIVYAAVTLALLVAGCSIDPAEGINCDKMPKTADKDRCNYNKSIIKVSSVECKNIMNDTYRRQCIDDVAVLLRDYTPCKQHDKASQRDACEGKVSDVRKKVREENQQPKPT